MQEHEESCRGVDGWLQEVLLRRSAPGQERGIRQHRGQAQAAWGAPVQVIQMVRDTCLQGSLILMIVTPGTWTLCILTSRCQTAESWAQAPSDRARSVWTPWVTWLGARWVCTHVTAPGVIRWEADVWQVWHECAVQEWALTKSGNVKHSDLCLSVSSKLEGERVKLKICDNSETQVKLKLIWTNVSNLIIFIEMEVDQGR